MRTIKIKKTVYGIGGYNPNKPNNNIEGEIEVDSPLIPVKKINFLLELQSEGIYRSVINDLNKFTEKEIILFNNLDVFDRSLSFMPKIIESAKITESKLDNIFLKAQTTKI